MEYEHCVVTQPEVDALVARIRHLVSKFGGQSPELESVRRLYGIFHARHEHAAFTFLTAAVVEAERL